MFFISENSLFTISRTFVITCEMKEAIEPVVSKLKNISKFLFPNFSSKYLLYFIYFHFSSRRLTLYFKLFLIISHHSSTISIFTLSLLLLLSFFLSSPLFILVFTLSLFFYLVFYSFFNFLFFYRSF
jgi:hypothetical protein